MKGISLPSAGTHNDCDSGATFINRFANSIEVAGSVERSTPTDPDRFLTVRYAVVTSQQRRTRVRCPSWQTVDYFAQRYETLGVKHYTRRRSVLTSDSECTFAIIYCLKSEVSRS